MAAYERVTLNRGGRNSRFDCTLSFSTSMLKPVSLVPSLLAYTNMEDDKSSCFWLDCQPIFCMRGSIKFCQRGPNFDNFFFS